MWQQLAFEVAARPAARPWWVSAMVGDVRHPSMLWTDEALVRAAAGGSSDAFSRIVERHQQGLRGFLRRACRDWALADDLAQETFLVAWEQIDRLKSGSSLRAWLCGIGYRKFLTTLRSDRRARLREAQFDEANFKSTSSGQEDRMALDNAMSLLPPEQRACVALCLAAEFSHAEASEALGMALGTVKSHVLRGRQALLASLGVSDDQS